MRLISTFGKFWYSRSQMSEAEGWLERMLALDERAGEQGVSHVLRADVLYLFGETLMSLGQLERAEAVATEALERARVGLDHSGMSMALALYRTFGGPTFTAVCLEGLATTLCDEGHYELTTRLCAAAAALREREAFEQAIASARAALGEPNFGTEWAAGSAFTQKEAIDDALRASGTLA